MEGGTSERAASPGRAVGVRCCTKKAVRDMGRGVMGSVGDGDGQGGGEPVSVDGEV